ncbi:STAS domain-containing protein [Streptomyces sp. NPDC048737]|uniref:STAS domain-containing protein n=1 Tax=unclassified Streptomyces TaxID=2593676 RepID=UPI00342F03A6
MTTRDPMEVTHEHLSDAVTVIRVAGDVTVYGAPVLRATLLDLLRQGRSRLIVDLSRSGHLDSTGLGEVTRGAARSRAQGGALVLVFTEERIGKILRVTGLVKAVLVFPTVARAVEHLARPEQSAGPR